MVTPGLDVDVAIVGGGILGLAAALELTRRVPGRSVLLLEREPGLAEHQTGHNSGVIHAGVYYAAGSLKAQLCKEGRLELERFCSEHGVGFRRSGKLIVATREAELPALDELQTRATANGVPGLARVGPEGIREIEPEVRGIAALHSPETGIVDYSEVCRALADELGRAGQTIRTGTGVERIESFPGGSLVVTAGGHIRAGRVLVCAGAWSDRLAVASGGDPDPRILPFRGAYLEVGERMRESIRSMVYPVPDPTLPFLGIHLTRHMDRSLSIGPTALMVGSLRAGRATSFNAGDAAHILAWPGTRKIAWRYRRAAMTELRNATSRRALLAEARRFLPELENRDVSPGFSGVRAQAVTRSGELVDDFVFSEVGRTLHVRNAPSPGATSSFAIAAHLADRLEAIA